MLLYMFRNICTARLLLRVDFTVNHTAAFLSLCSRVSKTSWVPFVVHVVMLGDDSACACALFGTNLADSCLHPSTTTQELNVRTTCKQQKTHCANHNSIRQQL